MKETTENRSKAERQASHDNPASDPIGAISREKDFLRSILDNLSEGVVVADTNMSQTFFNLAGEEIIGVGLRTSDPKEWQEEYGLFHNDQKTPFPTNELPLVRAASGERVDGVELFVRNPLKPDGVYLKINARPLLDDKGKLCGGIAIFRDVTKQKLAEDALTEAYAKLELRVTERTEELRKANKQLEQRGSELQSLSNRLLSLQEEERTRIAREIHDEFGQALTALKFDTAWLTSRVDKDKETQKRLSKMNSIIDSAVTTIRRIASGLRPGALDDLGPVAAMEWQIQEFQERTGIQVRFINDVDESHIDSSLAVTLFRVFQEAITNVARHAKAKNVEIKLTRNPEALELSVVDDGIGIDPIEANSPKAIGLIGMRERVLHAGGTLDIGKHRERGTRVNVRFPFTYKD